MIENSIMIGIMELRHSIDSKQPLKDRLKVAMRAALSHWLVVDEESQFKMAVGAVMVEASEEEKELIKTELKFLQGMAAAASGVPVDFVRLMDGLKDRDKDKVVGLRKLWDEAKAEGGRR